MGIPKQRIKVATGKGTFDAPLGTLTTCQCRVIPVAHTAPVTNAIFLIPILVALIVVLECSTGQGRTEMAIHLGAVTIGICRGIALKTLNPSRGNKAIIAVWRRTNHAIRAGTIRGLGIYFL